VLATEGRMRLCIVPIEYVQFESAVTGGDGGPGLMLQPGVTRLGSEPRHRGN